MTLHAYLLCPYPYPQISQTKITNLNNMSLTLKTSDLLPHASIINLPRQELSPKIDVFDLDKSGFKTSSKG